MSERKTSLLLLDIHTSVNKILTYTRNLTFETYLSDDKTKDAVERNFEIIGEAASRIPDDFKKTHPNIEWRIIKDFRNFIIHEYFGIDDRILWDIVKHHLPELLIKISSLIKSENN